MVRTRGRGGNISSHVAWSQHGAQGAYWREQSNQVCKSLNKNSSRFPMLRLLSILNDWLCFFMLPHILSEATCSLILHHKRLGEVTTILFCVYSAPNTIPIIRACKDYCRTYAVLYLLYVYCSAAAMILTIFIRASTIFLASLLRSAQMMIIFT